MTQELEIQSGSLVMCSLPFCPNDIGMNESRNRNIPWIFSKSEMVAAFFLRYQDEDFV